MDLNEESKAHFVRKMFAQIARRYEFMNRLMTAGQDRRWQEWVVRQARLQPGDNLLDIGSGTGGIARMALKRHGDIKVTAGDFTPEMMRVGRTHQYGSQILWCAADALALPFGDRTFDAVTSGYLLRNVSDPLFALTEQRRVLKPGGRMVCLDTSPPPRHWLYPVIALHLKYGIPLMGRLVSGNREAYRYLPESTRNFISPTQLTDMIRKAGFDDVSHRGFMFGTIAVHVGIRT